MSFLFGAKSWRRVAVVVCSDWRRKQTCEVRRNRSNLGPDYMANFQPRLSFVSDYMTKLSQGWNSNLCAGDSTITTNKMARRRLLLLKTKALILSQLGLLLALNVQLFGTVLVHQMTECKRNLTLAAHISAWKNYIYRKQRWYHCSGKILSTVISFIFSWIRV